jgi:hypothetical protein
MLRNLRWPYYADTSCVVSSHKLDVLPVIVYVYTYMYLDTFVGKVEDKRELEGRGVGWGMT